MKALFFDLDGTMWNAIDRMKDAYNAAMKKNDLKYRFTYEMVKSYMGLTPEETSILAFPDLEVEEGLRLFKIMYLEELEYLKKTPGILYPHVEKTLSTLKNDYPLYVVSNADKGYIETFFEGTGLGKYFKAHLAAGDTGLSKWENIKLLQEREKIDEVIYIGDTLKDKIEATKAGAKFIHAAYGFGQIDNYEYRIDSFDELPKLVNVLFSR